MDPLEKIIEQHLQKKYKKPDEKIEFYHRQKTIIRVCFSGEVSTFNNYEIINILVNIIQNDNQ